MRGILTSDIEFDRIVSRPICGKSSDCLLEFIEPIMKLRECINCISYLLWFEHGRASDIDSVVQEW